MVDSDPSPETLELRRGRGALGTGWHVVGSDLQSAGEVQGTIWLTLLYLPVLPLRSVRARPRGEASPGGDRRLEVVSSGTLSLRETLTTMAVGLLGWVLAWTPFAFALYWVKRGSLLAPVLHRAGQASWIQAVAGAAESFEGALRLLVGAWLLLLAAALSEHRRPRVARSRSSAVGRSSGSAIEPGPG
jgi:hypothetical protein